MNVSKNKRSKQQDVSGVVSPSAYQFVSLVTLFSSGSIRCVFLYKRIILPVVLYGRETWSLTLREQHRLRVFQNRVLRRIFGPKRDG
jgi:hypothetical protein